MISIILMRRGGRLDLPTLCRHPDNPDSYGGLMGLRGCFARPYVDPFASFGHLSVPVCGYLTVADGLAEDPLWWASFESLVSVAVEPSSPSHIILRWMVLANSHRTTVVVVEVMRFVSNYLQTPYGAKTAVIVNSPFPFQAVAMRMLTANNYDPIEDSMGWLNLLVAADLLVE